MEETSSTDIDRLIMDLRSQEAVTRNAAAEQLGKLKSPDERIIEALKTVAISDTHRYVRDTAEAALQALGSPLLETQRASSSVQWEKTRAPSPVQMFDWNGELENYVRNAQGLSRKGLNIMCFIGVFIFGWLLAVAFDMLGKKIQGWFYVVPLIACLAIARYQPILVLVGAIIYVVGWVHANMILSLYESLARQRVEEIDHLQSSARTTDILLEKGLLLSKVLRQVESSCSVFAEALQMPGGNPQLLNLAGVSMFACKRYNEAKQLFDRALTGAKDESLIKQVKLNQTAVEKRMK